MNETKQPVTVPFVVFESELVRLERINRRMLIVCVLLGIMEVVTVVSLMR